MRAHWRLNPMNKRIRAYRRGHRGEMLAALLLMLKGYRILAKRWKSPYGEIDLVAKRANTLVFVEVKARPSEREAMEAISPHQRQRIAQAAGAFLQTLPATHTYACRFDVIAYRPPVRLFHLKDAWRL